jgi:hypothetical protein
MNKNNEDYKSNTLDKNFDNNPDKNNKLED